MKEVIPPKYFFRYRSNSTGHIFDELRNAISKREFYFSSAQSLNDPFEIRPTIEKPSDEDFLELLKKKYGKNPVLSREASAEILGFVPSRQVHRNRLKKFAPSIETARLKIEVMEKNFAKLSDRTRVVCFNETPSSLPMWAHYANNHQGICLCFKFILHQRLDQENVPLPVSYSEKRPILNIGDFEAKGLGSDSAIVDAEMDIARYTFLTKSNEWSYEKEWRAFDNSGHAPGYKKMSAIVPDSVIFGKNAKSDFKDRILKEFTGKVDFYESDLSEDSYALNFRKIG